MHTVIVLGTALLLLALTIFVGRLIAGRSGMARACLWFVPLWFLGAAVNMYIGVAQAGYSIADETPMFLLVFSVPVAIALLVRRQLK
jgi:hypothetical protein